MLIELWLLVIFEYWYWPKFLIVNKCLMYILVHRYYF